VLVSHVTRSEQGRIGLLTTGVVLRLLAFAVALAAERAAAKPASPLTRLFVNRANAMARAA